MLHLSQVLRILTIGSADGKGGFFPQGVNGRINNTLGETWLPAAF